MKKWLLLLLVPMILIGCAQEANHPNRSLSEFFVHMQKGEYAEAEAYIASDENERLADNLESFGKDSDFVRIMRAFEFELEDAEITDDTAIVQVSSKYRNLVPAFSGAMNEMTGLIFTDPSLQALSQEQIEQRVFEMLSTHAKELEPELEWKEESFPVTMVKNGESWQVNLDNEALVLMLSGHLFKNQPE